MKQFLFVITFVVWLTINLAVRTVGLEISPPSLHFDEAALGYNAYSLMLTGKDEYGTPWPISLRSFNDYKPALYAYFTIPFIRLFGLTQTAVRLTSAVFGTISLIFLLLIFKQTSRTSWTASLLVTSFLSLLPWRLHFSRVALEANLSMAFFTATVWCLLNFHKHHLYQILLILFSSLSLYSYHSPRLAIPLLLVLFIFDPLKHHPASLARKPSSLLKTIWPLAVIFLLYLPIFWTNSTNSIFRRLQDTNLFSHFYPYTPRELIASVSPWTNWLAHPLYYLGGTLVGHISSYFSPQNLSLSLYHWVIKSSQAISGSGMIGPLAGLLLLPGLWLWLKNIKTNHTHRLLFYWILAGLAPAAITWEWFHPLRSLNIFPAIEIITGLGLIWLLTQIRKLHHALVRLAILVPLAGLLISSSIYNSLNELNYSIWDTHGEFQPGGYKEGAALLASLKDKYATVYIDSPHAQNYIFFLFYLKIPPQNIQALAHTRPTFTAHGTLNFNFDNFVYKKFHWPEDKFKQNFLYWTSSEVKPEEIATVPGTHLYKITDPFGRWVTSIITKD